MSFVQGLCRFFEMLLDLSKSVIVLARYDQWTIAEYFRKQGAQIGDNCLISVRSLGREPYLVRIGNHVLIAPGVVFHTHDGGAWIFTEEIPDINAFGNIVIEDNCLIGANSQLLPNIRIGKNSIVGAGSVVISDVPPNSIVMGVPARIFGSTLKYKENCVARWKEQKPPDYHIEQGRKWWTSKYYMEPNKESKQKLRRHLTNLFADLPPKK